MSADKHFSSWLGKQETAQQLIDPQVVGRMAAMLNVAAAPGAGQPLPHGWHWLFFNPAVAQAELGQDGHPRRDVPHSFLPPIALPRRMWAGGRIRYLQPLSVGAVAQRTSRITQIAYKEGRSGTMCFVTVEHTWSADGRDCIIEAQDIVYRDAAPAPAAGAVPAAVAEQVALQHHTQLLPDAVLLFRYSALSFNGHRIHYDLPYARDVEGYRSLVVHGPLTATLLQQFAHSCLGERRMTDFHFKGVQPLFVDEAMQLQAWTEPESSSGVLQLRALNAQGALAMQAAAHWETV